MIPFCNTPLWDWNLTWYSESPDFTPCFEQTVLAWVPLGFLWIFSALDLVFCYNRPRSIELPWSALNLSKLTVTLGLILHQVVVLGLQGYSDTEGVRDSHIVKWTPVLRIVTFALLTYLVIRAKVNRWTSSGVHFFFWLLMVFCEAFTFRTTVWSAFENESAIERGLGIAELVYFTLALLAFLLNCWADRPSRRSVEDTATEQKSNPESSASFLSKLLFAWVDKLIWTGYKKPLEPTDLWKLNKEDRSNTLLSAFMKHWQSKPLATEVEEETTSDYQRLHDSDQKKLHRSILTPLAKVFWPMFLMGALFELLEVLAEFAAPLILKLLISFVGDKNVGSGHEVWKGYLYTILILASTTTQTILRNQYYQQILIGGLRIRTSLINVIYRKCLLISNAARKDFTAGEIVNLQGIDVNRFRDVMLNINLIWSMPLQMAISLFLLWSMIGPSVFAGLGVMILLIPINAYIASKNKGFDGIQMELKDSRIKQMNEILAGIKVLKLHAWEPSFAAQLMNTRGKEMSMLKRIAYLDAGSTFVWNVAPCLVALASFSCFVFSDPKNLLDPETAFVALALFNILRFPMGAIPYVISTMIQLNVSLKRVNKFMNSEELDADAVNHDYNTAYHIVLDHASFVWQPIDEQPLLKDVNLSVTKASLVGICGPVGCGKSSLLSAILGEMCKTSGRVNTNGSIAYVAQQAWIQNASIRDNILFGQPFDSSKYDKIITACALKPDLATFATGDRTEIGEKGINLSGGQKQRISLARAVYHDCDIYLLDDPLSAVDAHVGKHIFEQVLGPKGLLKAKTRLLVTHTITFLPQVDNILVLKDGSISESGTYAELLTKKSAFTEFLLQHGSAADNEVQDSKQLEEIAPKMSLRNRTLSRTSTSSSDRAPYYDSTKIGKDEDTGSVHRMRLVSTTSLTPVTDTVHDTLIEDEKLETGPVSWGVYVLYLKAIGWRFAILACCSYLCYQALVVASDVWLSIWSDANSKVVHDNSTSQSGYLGVYGALWLAQGLGTLTSSLVIAYASLRASSLLHNRMLDRILRAPMSFFDTVPLGRVVNRFSQDVNLCDKTLGQDFESCLEYLLRVVAVLSVVSYSTPVFLLVAVPAGVVYAVVLRFYIRTSRQLRRLDSASKSPIFSHFSETLSGCSTIRAFAAKERFISEGESRVDTNQTAYYASFISNRWLAVRLEMLGNVIIFFAALFAVTGRANLSPGMAGLSISYALNITTALNWMVRSLSALEADIVAVERIQEYTEIGQEAPWEVQSAKPTDDWPANGAIVFENYQTRYRDGLDLTLRGINCKIFPQEKIGVVGRTGAGKSTLALALFRIIEPTAGRILVDDTDLRKLGLHDVRGRMTIIPQDPVLFCGSLRMNLDPFSQHSDEQVWRVLEQAHLKSFMAGLSAGLQYEVSEGGENLSVGQRQLVSLARALLRETKILVLDEATAAVDLETDKLIQATIRTAFSDCTIITIAHRLNTVMDSTRVMVLDKGKISEFESPAMLLLDKNSIFYGMAKDAGLA